MLHPQGLQQKSFKKNIYLALWKILKLHKKCEFHATNEQEKIFIKNKFGAEVKVWVIQNLPNVLQFEPSPQKQPKELKMATIALISPMKNHLEVLHALAGCTNKIAYDIYGPVKDKLYWNECMAVIKKLPANIRVNYHGDVVPHKIESILTNIDVYIQPSKSENFGHSIYEALSKGRPVITSNGTPWNNLKNSKAGLNIAPGEKAELTKAIDFFAALNTNEIAEWGGGARSYAMNAVDVAAIKKQYIDMFSNNSFLN